MMLKAVSFQVVPPLPAFSASTRLLDSYYIDGCVLSHNRRHPFFRKAFSGNDLAMTLERRKGVCWREFINSGYSISRKITKMIPKRFRYRLSTLFVATFVMSLGAVAYGYHLRAVQREEKAFRSIVALGGSIDVRIEGTSVFFTDPGVRGCGTGLLRVMPAENTSDNFADSHLYLFEDIRKLRHVDFRGSSVTPDSIQKFQRSRPTCSVKES